jgi:hypothetical protein
MLSDFFDAGHTPIRGVGGKARNKTADFTVTIPEGWMVTRIYIRNDTANAVTGGIKVGTTAGGVDVLAAGAVAASAVVHYAPLIGAYSASGARTLYVAAVTAWNSAQIDFAVDMVKIVSADA